MATAKTSTDVTSDSDVQEPHTVVVMQQLLESMGLERYEPRVVNQMVDFMYRYITDVLLDAETYAEHAGERMHETTLMSVPLIQPTPAHAYFSGNHLDVDDHLRTHRTFASTVHEAPCTLHVCLHLFSALSDCGSPLYRQGSWPSRFG